MTENPPPPSGTPEGGGATPPPPQNPYGAPGEQPSSTPPPPQNPYASQPPPPADPYAGNPPAAGQSPYGAAPSGQNPYGADPYPVTPEGQAPVADGTAGAGLGYRFLGRLLDGLIFVVVNIILGVIIDSTALAGFVGTILYVGYFVFLESSRGQTLGKQALGMRVHGASGGNPTMEEALRRNAWAALGLLGIIPVLGIIAGLVSLAAVIYIAVTIAQDPQHRGWHDKFANTTVTKR